MERAAAVQDVVPMVMGNHMVKGMVERLEVQEALHRLHNKGRAQGMVVHTGENHFHDNGVQVEGSGLLEV